jgi:hypothetical protein
LSENKLIKVLKTVKGRGGKAAIKAVWVKGAGITAAKWAHGKHDAAFFDAHGQPLSYESGCLSAKDQNERPVYIIEKNGLIYADGEGVYTVYARDLDGVDEVKSIQVKNPARPFPYSILIAAVLTAVITCCIVFFIARGRTGNHTAESAYPAAASAVTDASGAGDTHSASTATSQQSSEMVTDEIASSVTFSSGSTGTSGAWKLENASGNKVIMQAQIYLGGALIATSAALKPGQSAESIKLSADVGSGSYTGIAYINYYNLSSREFISRVGYHIGITVK